ncbi:hypothetical protein [Rossellomorea vietnamensis]|uniref:hypothetical protein n=1 Tax=Rossellomorea vietnamensis TaxID=218284 RepID=UPI003D2B33B6
MQREVKLFSGLKQPSIYFYQLKETERLIGLQKRIFFLLFTSAIVFGLVSSLGIGMDSLSTEITKLSPIQYEMEKFIFFLGRIISGILYGAAILFLPALLFWLISDLGEYKQLVVIQCIVLIISLLEYLTLIPLSLFFSLDWFSSPLSLGVIAQYITSNTWVIYFLGCFSLFKIWIFYIQYKGLKRLTEQKNWIIWGIILLVNVIQWAITALLAYLNFLSLL